LHAARGCRNAHYSAAGYRGYCNPHFTRWKNHGDPLKGPTIKGEPHAFLRDIVYPYSGDDCLEWPFAKNKLGRGQIRLDGKTVEVGRLACEAKNGPPPTPEHEAAHNCGNGHLGCCNPNHFRWDTHEGNQRDRVAHGTSNRGVQSGKAKLTPDKVRKIRELRGQKKRMYAPSPNAGRETSPRALFRMLCITGSGSARS
jgi:hypothetical protein